MQFNALFLFLYATGAMAAPRILGCSMSNGALNPSGNICTSAGGQVVGPGKCCTNGPYGPAVTEARFIDGCNNNGGSVGPGEIFGGC